jgi:hypothetical protein
VVEGFGVAAAVATSHLQSITQVSYEHISNMCEARGLQVVSRPQLVSMAASTALYSKLTAKQREVVVPLVGQVCCTVGGRELTEWPPRCYRAVATGWTQLNSPPLSM